MRGRGAAATECLVDKNLRRAHNGRLFRVGERLSPVAHLILRCDQIDVVVMTGLDVEPEVFESLRAARCLQCRFCGQDHAWEIVDRIPRAAVLMSRAATDCLRRSLQSDANAARAIDADVRALYERMAGRWFQQAIKRDQPVDLGPGFAAPESLFAKRERGPYP
jgi:hypothetical protein